jgi:hypothetical protein
MNYSDYTINEVWKNVSTEEIIKIKKAAKKLVILNNEWFLFHLFMLVFSLPSFVLMFSNLSFGFNCFVINLVIYTPIWFFYLKIKHVNTELLEQAKKRIEEMDIVLKYR